MVAPAVFFVGICAGYLYLRFRCRGRDYSPERQWPAHGIDVTRAAERIQRVRHDYVSELQGRRRRLFCHAGLLATVRKVVAKLPYFNKQAYGGAPIEGHDGAR